MNRVLTDHVVVARRLGRAACLSGAGRWRTRGRLAVALAVTAVILIFAATSHAAGGPSPLSELTGWRSDAAVFSDTTTAVFGLALLLAAGTLVSEDAACVAAGALAAQGRLSFAAASAACLLGIYVGDVLLFLAGRYLGRRALGCAPLRWFVKPEAVERGSAWFAARGPRVVVLSRFLPGTRLPTYFAAGMLDTSLLKFSLYFLLAAAVWTPLLVGVSMLAGAEAARSSLAAGEGFLVRALAAGALAVVVVKVCVRLSSRRGRRLCAARLRRLARWKFWPPWAFYPPVVLYVVWLGLRHRSLTLFTCANPAVPAGGFVGESKIEILRGLASSGWARGRVARAALVPASSGAEARAGAALDFMREERLSFPVVVKPDAGQRGAGVYVVRDGIELRGRLREARGDSVVQEHVAGREFGVFYYRPPGARRGRIFSITDKRFPEVKGDGRSTLEELIWRDSRAVLMRRAYAVSNRARLRLVPAAGERVTLTEIGSHCRGALFLDGRALWTPELERAVDRLSRGYRGFYFGRYDVRAASDGEFRRGHFKVIELNGVTSEATSIYDPENGLLAAYRTLFRQWRIAFEIGALNRADGCRPTPLSALVRLTARSFAGGGGARRAGGRGRERGRE